MPLALERKLKTMARKRGYGKERMGAYVHGTMKKMEKTMPSEEEMQEAMKKRLKKA